MSNWLRTISLSEFTQEDTIISRWNAIVKECPNVKCLIIPNTDRYSISYSQLNQQIIQYSKYLKSIGINKNDGILFLTDTNNSNSILIFLSIIKIGAIFIGLSLDSYRNLFYITNEINPKYIIIGNTSLYKTFYEPNKELHIFKYIIFSFNYTQNNVNDFETDTKGNDIAIIQYTTGSTSIPKGALLTHHNLLTSTWCYKACHDKILSKHHCVLHNHSIDFPAGMLEVLATILTANTLILATNIRNNIFESSKIVKQFKCEIMILSGKEMQLLLSQFYTNKNIQTNLANIRVVSYGGTHFSYSIIIKFIKNILNYKQCHIYFGYGLSEIGCQFCSHKLSKKLIKYVVDLKQNKYNNINVEIQKELSTIGQCCVGTNVRIKNDENKYLKYIPVLNKKSVCGELEIATPGIMVKYWKKTKLTQKIINYDKETNKKWLSTGDLAHVDPDTNRIYILGRIKEEIILPSGRHILSTDIENIIYDYISKHDLFINDVVCLPYPYSKITDDEDKLGELPLVLLSSDNYDNICDKEIVINLYFYCKNNSMLNKYDIPIAYIFIKDLPRNARNKINKIKLNEMIQNGYYDSIIISQWNTFKNMQKSKL